jgi:hypothetical protein
MQTVSRAEYDALVNRIEAIIAENKCEDQEVQRALLQVAQDHIWRAGLWARIRWAANIIGAFGIIAGFAMGAAAFLGYDVVRK